MADNNFLSSLLNYGQSFAQGASNSIAGNVSAPIDGMAWLLRKAGVPMPLNPMGGSDWMNQQGLTQQPQYPLAGMLGEAAGMAGPMVAAAKAPQIAGGLLRMGENAMVPRTMNPQAGAVVWHGPNAKNDLNAAELQNLISSQRYLDRDIVAQKIKDRNFTVNVTPKFDIFGEKVRAITDGHHALEAAIMSGNAPKFVVDTPSMNDRIGLLKAGKVDDYLGASYHDAPWYNFATKQDLF